MNISLLFGLLLTFTSVQYEVNTLDGMEVINEKVIIRVYQNKICFDKECYYISKVINAEKKFYQLVDGSNVQIRESRVIYRTEYDTRIYYQKKMY